MNLKNVEFKILHNPDGSARFQIDHGGTLMTVDLTSAERQRLGLMFLDANYDSSIVDTPLGEVG